MATQARLLRVLETGEYIRVGGQRIMKTNVRIVAATNVNMRKAISEGRFREDLFYRLNTIPIQMPPLRDRGNDIILLFRLFAMQMAEKYKLPKISLTEDAKALMLKYKWPGNVRQLKNITEQISILSREREIDAKHLQKFIPQDPESTQLAPMSSTGSHSYENERELLYKILYELRGNVSDLRREVSGLKKRLDDGVALGTELPGYSSSIAALNTKNYDTSPTLAAIHSPQQAPLTNGFVEAEEINEADNESLNLNDLGRQMVEKALERNGGNRKKAAIELGISDRTLYRRIKQYGLESSK